MDKILKLKQLLASNNKDVTSIEVLSIFEEQIEETTAWTHLCLTKEQYEVLEKDFDFSVFGDILISVKQEGTIDFIHFFDIENINSIKEKGLLVSYSLLNNNYIPDMGYGIYAEEGDNAYEISDELAEFLIQRYDYDYEDVEVGYIEGTYTGEYIECICGYKHEGYIVLKDDVNLKMIKNIGSEYISALAKDLYDYEMMY